MRGIIKTIKYYNKDPAIIYKNQRPPDPLVLLFALSGTFFFSPTDTWTFALVEGKSSGNESQVFFFSLKTWA